MRIVLIGIQNPVDLCSVAPYIDVGEEAGVDVADEYMQYCRYSLPDLLIAKQTGETDCVVFTEADPNKDDMTQTYIFLDTEDSGQVLVPFSKFDEWSEDRVYNEQSYEQDTWGDAKDLQAKADFKRFWETGDTASLQEACWSGEDQCPGFYVGVFKVEMSSIDHEIQEARKAEHLWDPGDYTYDYGPDPFNNPVRNSGNTLNQEESEDHQKDDDNGYTLWAVQTNKKLAELLKIVEDMKGDTNDKGDK